MRKLFKSALVEGATYDEQRLALLRKYGEPIPNSQDFKILDVDGYNEDLGILLAIEVPVEGAMPTMDEILSAKDGRLHGEDFDVLEPLMSKAIPT